MFLSRRKGRSDWRFLIDYDISLGGRSGSEAPREIRCTVVAPARRLNGPSAQWNHPEEVRNAEFHKVII